MAGKLIYRPFADGHARFEHEENGTVTTRCECGWTYVVFERTRETSIESANAFAAHAVETHNLTFKKNPVGP